MRPRQEGSRRQASCQQDSTTASRPPQVLVAGKGTTRAGAIGHAAAVRPAMRVVVAQYAHVVPGPTKRLERVRAVRIVAAFLTLIVATYLTSSAVVRVAAFPTNEVAADVSCLTIAVDAATGITIVRNAVAVTIRFAVIGNIVCVAVIADSDGNLAFVRHLVCVAVAACSAGDIAFVNYLILVTVKIQTYAA